VLATHIEGGDSEVNQYFPPTPNLDCQSHPYVLAHLYIPKQGRE